MSCETNNSPRKNEWTSPRNINIDAALGAEAARNFCREHKSQENKEKPNPEDFFSKLPLGISPTLDRRKMPPTVIWTRDSSTIIPLVYPTGVPAPNNPNIQVVPWSVWTQKFKNQNKEDWVVRIWNID